VARGFQAARADGLIEAIPDRVSRGEPVYALTRAGEAALPAAGAERRDQVRASGGAIAVEAVLGVVAEFTEASIGLVAWELCMREDQILAVWQRAFDEGLLENSAYDAVHNEQMARLTARGTERLAVVDEMTG
jgi:hypothetical protein